MALGTVGAADPDGGDTVRYSITGGNTGNLFAIDSATGALTFVGSDSGNYEASPRPSYELTVEARDRASGGLTDTATVTVNLVDFNEAPAFGQASYAFTVATGHTNSFGQVSATDEDASGTVNSYAITGGNTGNLFSINATTGELSATGTSLGTTTTPHTLTVTATSSDGSTSSAQVDVTVVEQPGWELGSDNDVPSNRVALLADNTYQFYLGGSGYYSGILGNVDAGADGIGVTYSLSVEGTSHLRQATQDITSLFSINGNGQLSFRGGDIVGGVSASSVLSSALSDTSTNDHLAVTATFSDGSAAISTIIRLSNADPPSVQSSYVPLPRPPEPVIEMEMAPTDPILDPGFPGYTVNPDPGGIQPIAPDMGL